MYLIVRFVNDEGKKSAPSEVQGPRIVKTPAGGMSSVYLQLYMCYIKIVLYVQFKLLEMQVDPFQTKMFSFRKHIQYHVT